MAGGKITRISGGINSTECDIWKVYTNNFNISANEGSHFTADEGTNIGEPEDAPSAGTHLVKGWWTDENDKRINEASIGDNVKFHLQVKDIPKNDTKRQVRMELRDFAEFSWVYFIFKFKTDHFIKEYNEIKIKGFDENGNEQPIEHWEINSENKVIIKLFLGGSSLTDLLKKEVDKTLELFFRASYINPENYIEVLEFPEMESEYLKVTPPPIVEPIIFVNASNEHELPAIYSAKDGSPWYVSVSKKIATGYFNADKISKIIEPPAEKLSFFEKKAYEIAVRKIKKGELIFNSGRSGFNSKVYKTTLSDIDGKFKEKVVMAVNRGNFVKGETSKGINQLEAQASRGLPNAIRTVGEIAGVFGVLSNLASLLRGVSENEIPPPPIIPPFIQDIVSRMKQDYDEFIIENWNKKLQKTIILGKDAVKKFLEDDYTNKEKNLGFKLIELSEAGLEKLLQNEIKAINDKTNTDSPTMLEGLSYIGEGARDSGILVQSLENEDEYGRTTKHHYIHALFVNDLVI